MELHDISSRNEKHTYMKRNKKVYSLEHINMIAVSGNINNNNNSVIRAKILVQMILK